MNIRMVFASPDAPAQALFRSLLRSSQELTCFTITSTEVTSQQQLAARVDRQQDDVVVLDWSLAQADTPLLVADLLRRNPGLRIITLLPEIYRQYREQVWQAGACTSVPKEHIDQEWLASVLCVMHRAMEREAKLLHALA